MKTNSHSNGAALLLFATVSWGSLFHVGKSIIAHVDPFWFTLARYVTGAMLLAAVVALTGPVRWRLLPAHAGRLAFHGVAGYAVFGIGTFIGLQWTTPSHAAVIMATMPISTVVARAVIDRRMPAPWTWGVALLALGGVLIVSGVAGSHGIGGSWHGDAIVFLSSLGWVTYTLGPSALPQLDAREYPLFSLLLAVPVIALAVAIAGAAGAAHEPSAEQWAAAGPQLLYTVLVPTVAAVLAFNRGVRELGAVNAMLFINVVPVSALMISAARGQSPTAAEIAGSALVIAAIVLQNRMLVARAAVPA
jgi:drug/metabolite transporter (DMT)-like permease